MNWLNMARVVVHLQSTDSCTENTFPHVPGLVSLQISFITLCLALLKATRSSCQRCVVVDCVFIATPWPLGYVVIYSHLFLKLNRTWKPLANLEAYKFR